MLRRIATRLQSLPAHRAGLNSFAVTRGFCDKIEKSEQAPSDKLSGFAKAFEKHSQPQEAPVQEKQPDVPFATLLRHSKFIEVSSANFSRISTNHNLVCFSFSSAIPRTRSWSERYSISLTMTSISTLAGSSTASAIAQPRTQSKIRRRKPVARRGKLINLLFQCLRARSQSEASDQRPRVINPLSWIRQRSHDSRSRLSALGHPFVTSRPKTESSCRATLGRPVTIHLGMQ